MLSQNFFMSSFKTQKKHPFRMHYFSSENAKIQQLYVLPHDKNNHKYDAANNPHCHVFSPFVHRIP